MYERAVRIFRQKHARQTAHTTAQLQYPPIPKQTQITQNEIGKALFRWPNAHVAGVIEADQIGGREFLCHFVHDDWVVAVVDWRLIDTPIFARLRNDAAFAE